MNELVAYLAVFLACLCRTLLPYVYKKRQDEELRFKAKYIATFLGALVASFILANLIFPVITIPEVSDLLGFATVFASAWGMNDIINTVLIDAYK